MGGMAAQIPVKGDRAANEAAFAKVRADKEREAANGHDGTWVAHPDLVPVARRGVRPPDARPQPARRHARATCTSAAPTCSQVHEGERTEAGLRENIRVGVQYIEAWLRGPRRRAALQSDGGRGDRRNLARPDLAVAAPRRRSTTAGR